MIELFKQAFQANIGSCVGECQCGKYFYNPSEYWDWNEGELEVLEDYAIPLDESVSFVEFEGCMYVEQCDCWHERADRIANFLVTHKRPIAEFFKMLKVQAEIEAASIPKIVT